LDLRQCWRQAVSKGVKADRRCAVGPRETAETSAVIWEDERFAASFALSGMRSSEMKPRVPFLTMLAAAAALQAADPIGHYVLQGVREVGSELLLKPDGGFEFM